MIPIRRCLKSLSFKVLLGLLTLFLVTAIFPAVAPQSLINERSASIQLEQGRTLYEGGQFAQAASVWQQASNQYKAQGDLLNAALSLSYLTLAYQELGQWEQAQSSITKSLDWLQQQSELEQENLPLLAQALNTKGSLQLAMGQPEAALESWQQAEDIYTQAKDETGILGSQINQAQALQSLGLFRRSQQQLEQVNEKLEAQPDKLLKATGLRSLGAALQLVGDLTRAQQVLKESYLITQQLGLPQETSATLFSLGNTARALGDKELALNYYQQAAATAASPIGLVEAQLNQLSLLIETQQQQAAQTLLSQIQPNLSNLPSSRAAVYARVNLAQSLIEMADATVSKEVQSSPNQFITELLTQAQQQAESLNDTRAQSYVLGTLGRWYEEHQQWSEAQRLTQQALLLAQDANAADIAYQWQWQLGRLLKAQGNFSDAIAADTEAVNTLQLLRSDLVAINPDVQFSFRESVEPVYRELVGLLLQSPTQDQLKQARQVIESLQLAELENFFREACLDAQPKQIDEIDPTAAVIYPIILPDRLAVILSLPGLPLRHYETPLPQPQVEEVLAEFLQSLNLAFSSQERLRLSQQVYDWLVQPAEKELANHNIKTLVFVPDGFLRNLPMAALHDGQQYLVEKYSIALNPGLQLLPQVLQSEQLKAVLAGVSEPSQGFSALPAVEVELEQISSQIPSEKLLNQEFTRASLQQQIGTSPVPVIHLATHGQFSSDPQETFIITWRDRVNVKEFRDLLRVREQTRSSPIELLILSACQTAAGDKRAALGLAGMAVRSGARSTVATLWSVRDRSTALLMTQFYQVLTQKSAGTSSGSYPAQAQPQSEVTKAEALRQAQLALVNSSQFSHPYFWAPFVLVGNWL